MKCKASKQLYKYPHSLIRGVMSLIQLIFQAVLFFNQFEETVFLGYLEFITSSMIRALKKKPRTSSLIEYLERV